MTDKEIQNVVAAQAKYDRLSEEERDAIDEAAERRKQLPWHPDHGNAPQHSMSDTPMPNTKNTRRY